LLWDVQASALHYRWRTFKRQELGALLEDDFVGARDPYERGLVTWRADGTRASDHIVELFVVDSKAR
jgi:hypothetical protein